MKRWYPEKERKKSNIRMWWVTRMSKKTNEKKIPSNTVLNIKAVFFEFFMVYRRLWSHPKIRIRCMLNNIFIPICMKMYDKYIRNKLTIDIHYRYFYDWLHIATNNTSQSMSPKWLICLSWKFQILPSTVGSIYCKNISQIGDIDYAMVCCDWS